MTDAKRINPDIRNITYGKKELKELTLYPLSIGDQFKVTDVITSVVQKLVAGTKENQLDDFVFMSAIINALEDNLGKVLELIADISEDEVKNILQDITNSQLVDIVESVWSVDYEPALKKGKSLFERGKSVFDLKRSLQNSSSATHNTDLKTSTEKVTEVVE